MNVTKYLVDQIFGLNPIQDIYKTVNYAKIIFSKKQGSETELAQIRYLESHVIQDVPLKICFELYYTYQDKNLNHVIIHRTKKGKIIKIPLYELRDSMRKLYFGIIEIICTSKIIESDFGVEDSGDMSYND